MPPYKIAKSADEAAPSMEEQSLRLAKARAEEWREQGAKPVVTDLATGRVLSDQDMADASSQA